MKTIAKTSLLILITFCLAAAVSANPFVVNITADTQDANPGDGVCADSNGNCSLRAAITETNALNGVDVITLPAGTYTQSLVAADEDNNAGGDWDVRQNLLIEGAGSATTIIQAAATPATATERVFHVVFNGFLPFLSLNNVTVRHGNKIGTGSNDRGGGIYADGGSLIVKNSIVTLNRASGGGGISAKNQVDMTGVIVSNNSCLKNGDCFGGGMQKTNDASQAATLTDCQFLNNTSTSTTFGGTGFGGGLAVDDIAILTVTGATFDGNSANGTSGTGGGGADGGALYLRVQAGTANISNSTFINNSIGGAQSLKGSVIMVSTFGSSLFRGTWDKLTIDGNTGGSGVWLENGGTTGMTINVNNSTISGNHNAVEGAGVFINSSGATSSAEVINFLNTTISGNTSSNLGGGVVVQHSGAGTTNANFNYCTIANNTTTSGVGAGGGGIFRVSGNVNLKNTVVADNTAASGTGPDISGTVNSQDYNHIENLSGATVTGITTHNSIGAANLGPLQINGAGPRTQLPGAGPVIDAIPSGTNDCGTTVTTDERGVTRPQGGGCDKGAAELEFPPGPLSLSGVIQTTTGIPIRNVAVNITGGNLPPGGITVFTGNFGTYLFTNLPGAQYTVTVTAKRFHFNESQQLFILLQDIINADFVANAPFGRETFFTLPRIQPRGQKAKR